MAILRLIFITNLCLASWLVQGQSIKDSTLAGFYSAFINHYFESRLDSIAKLARPTIFIADDSLPQGIQKHYPSFHIELLKEYSDSSSYDSSMNVLFRISRKQVQDTIKVIMMQIWNRDKLEMINVAFDRQREKNFIRGLNKRLIRKPDALFIYQRDISKWTYQPKKFYYLFSLRPILADTTVKKPSDSSGDTNIDSKTKKRKRN